MGAALFPGVGKGAVLASPVMSFWDSSRFGRTFNRAPFAKACKGCATHRGKSNSAKDRNFGCHSLPYQRNRQFLETPKVDARRPFWPLDLDR